MAGYGETLIQNPKSERFSNSKEMQTIVEVAEDSVLRKRMESMRVQCEKEVPYKIQKMDSFTSSFVQSLNSIKSTVEQTLQNDGKLVKLKSSLREAEDEFVKVLSVKTRQEGKQMAIRDSISSARARVEKLKRTLQIQRARRDEFAAIITHQSLDKEHQGIEDTQEAISWYNKVLGFNIEGGRGVTFTFNNINMKNPNEEYTFTVCHDNDVYTLLACDPHLNDTKELMHELNRMNGLFKFVRTIREKFLEAASLGISPQSIHLHQESAAVSVSAPVMSVSSERSESPMKENELPHEEKRQSKKVNLGKKTERAILTRRRQSPRFNKSKQGSHSEASPLDI